MLPLQKTMAVAAPARGSVTKLNQQTNAKSDVRNKGFIVPE
jgi:hypothetical protein